ncbi:MAG: RNA polymerase sigma factor [Myxococcota bacterium]
MLALVTPPRPLRLVRESDGDAALIDAVARGDASRAAALYDRLRGPISRAIRRVAPPSLEHEDLVQQTFAELVTALRKRPAIRNLEAFAAGVATRTVYQRVRRTKLEDRFCVSADGLLEVLEQPGLDGPHETTTRRQALRKVLELLAALPNQARVHVFVLHDVHGFELSEIADILGITPANAQSRLVRGRADVHEALAQRPELLAVLRGETP